VQNWPECAQNPNSYKPNPGFTAEQAATSLNPHEKVTLHSAPLIPALAFENRTRIELYAGKTTVAVFATTVRLAREAAEALGKVIAASVPAKDAAWLRASANQPGDGTACRTILTLKGE
jgi:hypothetical protein